MPALTASARNILAKLGAISDVPPEVMIPGAERILTHAQELCPVDTGFLRASGFLAVAGDDVQIGFTAEYASYVEFGTYKMAAQPYLRPAIDENEEEFLSITAAEYEKYIDQVIRGGAAAAAGQVTTQGNPFELQP